MQNVSEVLELVSALHNQLMAGQDEWSEELTLNLLKDAIYGEGYTSFVNEHLTVYRETGILLPTPTNWLGSPEDIRKIFAIKRIELKM